MLIGCSSCWQSMLANNENVLQVYSVFLWSYGIMVLVTPWIAFKDPWRWPKRSPRVPQPTGQSTLTHASYPSAHTRPPVPPEEAEEPALSSKTATSLAEPPSASPPCGRQGERSLCSTWHGWVNIFHNNPHTFPLPQRKTWPPCMINALFLCSPMRLSKCFPHIIFLDCSTSLWVKGMWSMSPCCRRGGWRLSSVTNQWWKEGEQPCSLTPRLVAFLVQLWHLTGLRLYSVILNGNHVYRGWCLPRSLEPHPPKPGFQPRVHGPAQFQNEED